MSLDRRRWIVLVLVLAVLGAGCRDDQQSNPPQAESDPVVPGPVVQGLADQCPDPARAIPYPPDARLPAGAVGVRLCNGVEDYGDGVDVQSDVQPPADELTTEVGDLVDLVNSSELADTTGFCPADGGPDLVFWFRYPDGTARAVRYGRHGCRSLTVGEGLEHTRGEDLHVAFAQRLAVQRSRLAPPASVPTPTCDPDPDTTALGPPEQLGLGTAALCAPLPEGGLRLAAVLTEGQLRRVERDYDPQPGNSVGSCTARRPVMLAGYTAWGDRFQLFSNGCTFALDGLRRTDDTLLWRLSPSLTRLFQRLTERR